jgi:protein TonB
MLGSNLDIMSPEWTDVIFKDRNQAYGAYQLRKNNAYNTNRALIIAASAFIFVLSVPTIINIIKGYIPEKDPIVKVIDVNNLPPPVEIQKQKIIPPPIQQKQVRSQHTVITFPPPIVRPDEEARKDPPNDKELDKNDVGPKAVKGDAGADINIDDVVGPKEIAGVTESTNNNDVFVAVEVSPEFPGGEAAFGKFLHDHIRYPSVAKENNTQGRVFLQFVVERDGSLTDIKIMRDPGSGLGDEALRVLKSSPHWRAGMQNGKQVRVQYTVPVNFSLGE